MGGEGEGVLASKRVSGAGSMRSTPATSLHVRYTMYWGKRENKFCTFLFFFHLIYS